VGRPADEAEADGARAYASDLKRRP